VVDIPAAGNTAVYKYLVPAAMSDEIAIGKRVLVDFGGRKTEAFIVEYANIDDGSDIKEVLQVLDKDALITENMMALAQWMADYYVYPLPMVLKMMIPRVLQEKRPQTVYPGKNAPGMDGADDVYREFINILHQQGQLSWKEALKYHCAGDLHTMEDRGLIKICGEYHASRLLKHKHVYNVGDGLQDIDLDILKKKAPRQAEILEHMKQVKSVPMDELDKQFPASAIRSLMQKGLLEIRRPSHETAGEVHTLNDEQALALEKIEEAISKKENREMLLYGVTGSGKTEVYLRATEAALKNGQGVVVLLPEIALTRQLVDIFASRIEGLAVLHSSMTDAERFDEWQRIKSGEARVVMGARSAIFAPVNNLGLLVIDEEQENAYKQEEAPRYHVRDVARQRALREKAVLLLGSATPSVESFYQALKGDAVLLSMPQRVGGSMPPQVIIEDLRKSFRGSGHRLISPLLQEKMRECLKNREQTILFINRRGYSPMTICRECGNIATCPFCSVSMTYHRDINQNVCHYCNHHAVQAQTCPQCGSKHLQLLGAGTQKVEEEVKELFPEAVIGRLDMDSSRKKGMQHAVLHNMRNRAMDILIGTQMVAKGLDFPGVSLVGIVDADSILNIPDFRASERCFQLLVQAAGRAGRRDTAGEVVIQTYNPDNMVIRLAARQDYYNYYRMEIKNRQVLAYPPFSRLLRVVLSSRQEEWLKEYAGNLAQEIEEILDAREDDIMILGPAPCPISRIRNRHRYQMIMKSTNEMLLRSIALYILRKGPVNEIKVDIDVNPLSTL